MPKTAGNNQCPAGSVGAIVRRNQEYLVLYRTSFPPGLAFVAGHLDEGETPEQALARELKEEVGIEVVQMQMVLATTIENPCKRGYASHEWWVFEVTESRGEPMLKEPEKHAFVRFMSLNEVRSYAEKNDMDPAWIMLLRELTMFGPKDGRRDS